MNKFVFLAVFMCALAFINAKPNKKEEDDSTEEAEKKFRELAQMVNEKYNTTLLLDVIKMAEQVKEKCPKLEEKLESVAEEMYQCVQEVELGSDTFCSLIKKNFIKCYKPARDLITSCLPEESKDLPTMAGKMMLAVIEQACRSTIEEMLEMVNPCAMEKKPDDLPACQEIKTIIDEHKNKLPSKSLICQTLPKGRNCAKAVMEGSCKNQITRETVMKFHDAIEHSIKEDCDSLNKA